MRTRWWYSAAWVGAAVLVATLARLALNPLLGPSLPFLTYFLAAVGLAFFLGFWPAAASVGLGVFVAMRFVLTSQSEAMVRLGRSEYAAVIGFAVSTLAVSGLLAAQKRTLLRARAAEEAQRKITKDLQQTNDRLSAVNHDLELFTYSAGHDLREPLRTISLMAQLLRRQYPNHDGSGIDSVRQIVGATSRMEKLLEDVSAYIGSTQMQRADTPVVDAKRVVGEVIESLKAVIQENGAVVEAGDLPVIAMHDHRLAMLFQNLISNAIKYRSEAAPRILISAKSDGKFWVFSVADNGIGIESRYREKIFGVFQRLHPASQYPGSGIGLAICQRIVAQYGGRIWLEDSTPGVGSTFRFSVPIVTGRDGGGR